MLSNVIMQAANLSALYTLHEEIHLKTDIVAK
jgi:hypothetical protein